MTIVNLKEQMDRLIRWSFERELLKIGRDGLITKLFDFFNDMVGNDQFSSLLQSMNTDEDLMHFDKEIRGNFADWFKEISEEKSLHDLRRDKYKNFKALMSSSDFMLLSFALYDTCLTQLMYSSRQVQSFNLCPAEPCWIIVSHSNYLCERSNNFEIEKFNRFDDVISLRSSDQVVYKMIKKAATAQSGVLRDLFECTGGGDEIPLPLVSGGILSKLIHFCEKQHDYDEILKIVKDRHEEWIRGFIETNQEILSDLHQAADYLNIPSLLDLTSQTVMGKSLEEIQDLEGTPSPWAFA